MQLRGHQAETGSGNHERLLRALADQLKLPLVQIARTAELLQSGRTSKRDLQNIELTADMALRLIDNYMLSTELAATQATLQLEPIAVSSVLHDTAHLLESWAKEYHCELRLHMSGRYEPVFAHAAGLRAALTSLGYDFIAARAARLVAQRTRPVITLAAHRGKGGIVAGMYADVDGLSTDMFRRGRLLYGKARQPLVDFSSGSAVGIYVADSLLSTMSARLRVGRHHNLNGLATTLMPSRQLNLV